MKIKLLPSSFESDGSASPRQHTTCFVIDDVVAIDAGSLAHAATDLHRKKLRDIIVTHAHLDHIAGLPLFVDDLFSTLTEPIRVHAAKEVIEVLERDVFNWSVYPKFSELTNDNGSVLEYSTLVPMTESKIGHLTLRPIEMNHKVPTCGFVISDGKVTIAFTGDTAGTELFWKELNSLSMLDALFIECAFPDELSELAEVSHHLTPKGLAAELEKFNDTDCRVFVINLKPMYRTRIIEQINVLDLSRVEVLEVGREYKI
jgi:ribonuclease BN (tRNA processing enzyme)